MIRLQAWSILAVLGAAGTAVVAATVGPTLWERGAEFALRSAGPAEGQAGAPKTIAALPPEAAPVAPSRQEPTPAAEAPVPPSFDVVRVEPDGEAVIAGRGAAGAIIEMLRDGQVHARTVADQSGLFALVPPPLPPGSHQIALQSIAPDGARQRSRESVTIVISQGRNTKPLVALTAPDKPTVVLSSPEPVEAKTAEAKTAEAKTADAQGAPAAKVAEVRIVSVESEEGGRLYVSGQAPPGSTVRLYLNETLIAPGSVGGDSKVAFAIDRGVRPGDYRVRLDEVDPVTGSVKSRAEVNFTVPITVAASSSSPPRSEGTQVASASTPAHAVGTVVVPNVDTVIVSPGESLWRISQRIYGSGQRYTMIFGANQKQIKDPNLIYPGQTFVVPSSEPGRAGSP